jgi:hypothetical protein
MAEVEERPQARQGRPGTWPEAKGGGASTGGVKRAFGLATVRRERTPDALGWICGYRRQVGEGRYAPNGCPFVGVSWPVPCSTRLARVGLYPLCHAVRKMRV